MKLEQLINILSNRFEIIDFTLPNGNVIQCIRDGTVLIPIAKVYIYGTGKVQFSDEEYRELRKLKQERKTDQKAFNRSQNKDKLRQLIRRQENWNKSQNNLHVLTQIGFSDSAEDMQKIIIHLIETGTHMTADTITSKMERSILDTLGGPLTILTGWRLLDNDFRYMTTIHFLPPKDIEKNVTF